MTTCNTLVYSARSGIAGKVSPQHRFPGFHWITGICKQCVLLTKERMRNVVPEFVRHGAITNIVFSNMAKVACYVVVGAVL